MAGFALWMSGLRDGAAAPDPGEAAVDLSVAISDDTSTVKAGEELRYEVVVTNHGPAAADGAVISVPAAPGLDKLRVSCAVEAGDAACPEAAALTLAAVERDGLTIPRLPVGARVALTVAAHVTAAERRV